VGPYRLKGVGVVEPWRTLSKRSGAPHGIGMDELLSTETAKGEVFALPGEIYAVYLPNGGQATLNLT